MMTRRRKTGRCDFVGTDSDDVLYFGVRVIILCVHVPRNDSLRFGDRRDGFSTPLDYSR
jgi:hypothetical protein